MSRYESGIAWYISTGMLTGKNSSLSPCTMNVLALIVGKKGAVKVTVKTPDSDFHFAVIKLK